MRIGQALLVLSGVCILLAPAAHAQLNVLDKPLWIFPGQQIRVVLEQPAGSGTLNVQVPETLEMFDQWDQDAIQRYYFRAVGAGDATLSFSGNAGELEMPLEVVAWGDVFTPREYKGVELPRIWPMEERAYTGLKSARTMHSEEDLAALRETGEVTDRALRWLEMTDEEVYNIIPGPSIPRMYGTYATAEPGRGEGKGCPVCGTDIFEGRNPYYPWLYTTDPVDWKLRCPNCETEFPSNDWAAGDMTSGPFPDDGFGCEPVEPVLAPDGTPWRWPFIAYYHQHAAYMREFTPGIIETARAYAITGDRAYARKSAIALLRFAESMVDMSLNLNHRKRAVRSVIHGPVGAPDEDRFLPLGPRSWAYVQSNWDYSRMQDAARAWDLVFDAIDDEVLDFARRHYHPQIRTVEDFRHFVETGILRVPIQMAIDKSLERNWPGPEVTAVTLALCLGTERATDVADWALNVGCRAPTRFGLTNMFYKDGGGEESPSYNRGHVIGFTRICQVLDDLMALHPEICQPPRFVSPARDPKFRNMFDFALDTSLIGRVAINVGDSGRAGRANPEEPRQGSPLGLDNWIAAYEATGDPRFAQAMYGPGGSLAEQIEDPELRRAAEQAGEELGWQVELESNILDGYGFAILRSGEDDDQRAMWMHYTRITKHNHPDMLSYGLAGLRRELLPELGYPRGWGDGLTSSWGSHYKTKITGLSADAFNRADLTTFVGEPPVQLSAAESHATLAGERCTRQRTIALIDLSPERFYALTIERVHGGEEHTFSFHGPDGSAEIEGVEMHPYEGTALGEGLEYGDRSAAEHDPELGVLAFMYDPSRGQPEGVWSMDCSLGNQDEIYLRMTSVYPEGGDLVLATARNPIGVELYEMPWAILTSRGEAPLTRQYLNVVEPYKGEAAIRSIERVEVSGGDPNALFEPLALRITTDEFVDTIILQHEAGSTLTVDGISFDGEFGFWRESAGELHTATLVRGTQMLRNGAGVTLDAAEQTSEVVECDWEASAIVVRPALENAESLPGRHARISNPHGSSASYKIVSAEQVEGGTRITLPLDPRVGEGFVEGAEDGVLISESFLKLHPFRYYAGKTLANETGEVLYRISDVRRGHECLIISEDDVPVSGALLEEQFGDRDGDGLRRFTIYDYGPGDVVTVANYVTAR